MSRWNRGGLSAPARAQHRVAPLDDQVIVRGPGECAYSLPGATRAESLCRRRGLVKAFLGPSSPPSASGIGRRRPCALADGRELGLLPSHVTGALPGVLARGVRHCEEREKTRLPPAQRRLVLLVQVLRQGDAQGRRGLHVSQPVLPEHLRCGRRWHSPRAIASPATMPIATPWSASSAMPGPSFSTPLRERSWLPAIHPSRSAPTA